jgi:hypothetical protein
MARSNVNRSEAFTLSGIIEFGSDSASPEQWFIVRRSPKNPSTCRFGGLKMPSAGPVPRFSGGTPLASRIEECGS